MANTTQATKAATSQREQQLTTALSDLHAILLKANAMAMIARRLTETELTNDPRESDRTFALNDEQKEMLTHAAFVTADLVDDALRHLEAAQ